MNTLYHRERILMSRLLLEMCRRASRYVEGKSLGAKMEAVLILIAIALGYMEGRPFTASKLAAYLDTPRTSVLRKLAQLTFPIRPALSCGAVLIGCSYLFIARW